MLYKRGNQVAPQGHSTYIMVVLFPGGLFTLYLLDSLYAGPQLIYVPVQLGPDGDHVLSAEHFPGQVQGVLLLYSSAGASGQGRSSFASEMCDHVMALHRHVEVRNITKSNVCRETTFCFPDKNISCTCEVGEMEEDLHF